MGIGAAIGGIAGGILQSNAAGDAAAAQTAAAQQQLQLEGRIYDETTGRFQPYVDIGKNALEGLAFELGLGERPTFGGSPQEVVEFTDTVGGQGGGNANGYGFTNPHGRMIKVGWGDAFKWRRNAALGNRGPQQQTRYRVGDQVFGSRDAADEYAAANPTGGTEYQGFQKTPGYDFQLSQGLNAIDNSAASRGNLFSGATMKAAQGYGQGLANQEYGNYLNRLTGMAGSGQAAAGNAANAGANYASGAGNAFANIGNAQAAGAIGSANAISGGINNAVGIWNYQNQLGSGSGGGSGGPGWLNIGGSGSLFGNNSWV